MVGESERRASNIEGRTSNRLRWEHWVAAALLAVMALIAFVNILGRFIFHYSLAYTEEFTINLFVWLTVVGSGIAFERGNHLGMVSLFNRFPGAMKKTVVVLNAVLATALFLAVDLLLVRIIYYEITLFQAKSPALGLPVWIYYAGVPVVSVAVFQGIWRGTRNALKGRAGKV